MRIRLILAACLLPAAALGCAAIGAPAATLAGAPASPPAAADTRATRLAAISAALVEVSTLRLSRPFDPLHYDLEPPFSGPEFAGTAGARWVYEPKRDVASGIVIGADGLILTNAHVVAEVDEIHVLLADGRRFPARVLGLDLATDVAVLKIAAQGLPVAAIGDSARLAAGDRVYALGSPFGFQASLTAGIVSASQRWVTGAGQVPFIQTDVATNPGSSGGPLLNRRFEVVGLNSVIYSASGGYMGVSFAVPINTMMKVAAQLIRHGVMTHPHLGIELQDVTPALARAFRLPAAGGALVLRIEAGSPADVAGLVTGDVVLAWDSKPIASVGDLLARIAAGSPGDRSQLRLWRQGRSLRLSVALAGKASAAPPSPPAAVTLRRHGLGLELSEPTAAQLRALRAENGLLVSDSVGAARSEGIRAGDLIVALNGDRLNRLSQFQRLVDGAAPSSTVALLVLREGRLAYVPIRVGSQDPP